MAHMTLAHALFFECPRCAQQIDVGESSEAVGPEAARVLAGPQGMQGMEGICPRCGERVTASVESLKSRVRN
jgi:endogenous inhibitor of DNA gyrase (YacG/DUF329 family)